MIPSIHPNLPKHALGIGLGMFLSDLLSLQIKIPLKSFCEIKKKKKQNMSELEAFTHKEWPKIPVVNVSTLQVTFICH